MHVNYFDQWRFFPLRFPRPFSCQTPLIVLKTTQLPRLHGSSINYYRNVNIFRSFSAFKNNKKQLFFLIPVEKSTQDVG